MSEREQLLAAVCANPDDDTPRLVFADWLEENGEPDRAAFIRAQIRFAQMPTDDPGWYAAEAAVRTPWKSHTGRWQAELPELPGVLWGEYRRGFVAEAHVPDPETFLREGDRIMAAAPVAEVRFGAWSNFAVVAECPALANLRRLRLGHSRLLSDDDLRPVFESPHAPRLTLLHVAFENLGPGAARALAACSHLTGLRELMICGNRLGDEGLIALAGSPHLTGLRAINAHSNGFGPAGVEALAASRSLGGLTDLHLGDSGIDTSAARALAASKTLTRLTRLNLTHHEIRAEGVRAIANSPNFAGLRHLLLQGWPTGAGRIGPEGAEAIARSPYLTQLRVLILFGCDLGDAGVAALASSPNVAHLTDLNLTDNDLTDAAVEALVNSPYLPRRLSCDAPPCLASNDRITAAGNKALHARFVPPPRSGTPAVVHPDEDIPF